MTLMEAKPGAKCKVKSIDIEDEKTKIRLMELGLFAGEIVTVSRVSALKKTLLIIINMGCFSLNYSIASRIQVNYV